MSGNLCKGPTFLPNRAQSGLNPTLRRNIKNVSVFVSATKVKIYVLQCSVVTQLKCSVIFNNQVHYSHRPLKIRGLWLYNIHTVTSHAFRLSDSSYI